MPATVGSLLRPVMISMARSADALHVPLRQEARVLHELAGLSRSDVWQSAVRRTDPAPVVLVGGMASSPITQKPMRAWLERAGHPVLAAPVRWGVDCGERTLQAVLQTFRSAADAHGRPPVVIAHSRGGQYARAAAVREPGLTDRLVTLGSPLVGLLSVHRILRMQCVAIGLAGTLGVPGLFGAGCLWGDCCRQLRKDLTGHFPDSVPFLSVYSRLDKVVTWTSCLDPAARHAEVASSHGGLLMHEDVYSLIDRELSLLMHEDVYSLIDREPSTVPAPSGCPPVLQAA